MSVSAKETEDENVPIEVLEKKLAGTPTALGRFAVPLAIILFFWKGALAVSGCFVIPYAFALARYEPVSIPWAKNAILSYVLLQIPDTVKNIVQRDSWDNYVHHALTGIGFLLDYFLGSDRTLAFCAFLFLGEIVAPAYQVTHALRHMRLGCSQANLFALKAGWWLTVLVRIPMALYTYPVVVADIYCWFVYDAASLPVYGELQVWARVPCLVGGVALLWLDQIWLGQSARMIKGVERVLAAKEKKKKH